MFRHLSANDILREERTRVREANDCHHPAGSPQGGQFCSKGEGKGARFRADNPDAVTPGSGVMAWGSVDQQRKYQRDTSGAKKSDALFAKLTSGMTRTVQDAGADGPARVFWTRKKKGLGFDSGAFEDSYDKAAAAFRDRTWGDRLEAKQFGRGSEDYYRVSNNAFDRRGTPRFQTYRKMYNTLRVFSNARELRDQGILSPAELKGRPYRGVARKKSRG